MYTKTDKSTLRLTEDHSRKHLYESQEILAYYSQRTFGVSEDIESLQPTATRNNDLDRIP